MPKRRTTDSAYILSCIIENSYRSKQTLIITSIDFRKAFDSVNSDKLLEVMTRYKIHPKVIDLIVNIYKEDSTTVTQNNRQNKHTKRYQAGMQRIHSPVFDGNILDN